MAKNEKGRDGEDYRIKEVKEVKHGEGQKALFLAFLLNKWQPAEGMKENEGKTWPFLPK